MLETIVNTYLTKQSGRYSLSNPTPPPFRRQENSFARGEGQLSEQLSPGNVTPFAERIKQAREQRRRNRLKVDHQDLRKHIKKVTKSQSKILQKIEDARLSRIQSSSESVSYSALPLLSMSGDKRRFSGDSFLPQIKAKCNFTRIPSHSKVGSDRNVVLPHELKTSPSRIPKAQPLLSLDCMKKTKKRMRENLINYNNSRPSEIIEQARKIEKMSRNREFALKSVSPLTSKALQMENRINNSLIVSIKAKLSVLVNQPV